MSEFIKLIGDKTPVLVQFTADWCGPCRMMKPLLKSVGEDRTDVNVFFLDVETNKDLARQYGIRSIPTIFLFKGGVPIDRYQAGATPAALNAWLNGHLV